VLVSKAVHVRLNKMASVVFLGEMQQVVVERKVTSIVKCAFKITLRICVESINTLLLLFRLGFKPFPQSERNVAGKHSCVEPVAKASSDEQSDEDSVRC